MNFKETYEKIGLLGTIFERLFHYLKFLPPQLFIEERIKHQNRLQTLDQTNRKVEVLKRLKSIEIIIFGFIFIYILFSFFIEQINLNNFWRYFVLLILTFRLLDLIQVNVNIALFDNLKITTSEETPIFIYSSIRSITLAILNFIEIGIIFGFYYSLIHCGALSETNLTSSDKFYFSFVTQLTIGYGDISPTGFFKLIAICQGLLGYFFTILIISRFINLLPTIKSEIEYKNNEKK